MAQQLDNTTTEQTLQDGESTTLTVRTKGHAENVFVYIDDGTSGSNAAGYELGVQVYDERLADYQYHDSVGDVGSPETALSWSDPAIPTEMKYVVTNRSGGEASYRVRVVVTR